MTVKKMTYEELLNQNNELRNIIIFQDSSKENIFKQLSDNMDDVFWLRTDKEMIYINPAFEKVWGIPCSEVYQNLQVFFDSIHPDDKARILDIFKSNFYTKVGFFDYEYRIIRPDKQLRWVYVKTLPIFNNEGEIIRRVGVARDITQQKVAHEETSLLAEMLNVAPNSITIHDAAGKFLFVNQKTYEIHGYSPREFAALNLRDLDVPESAELIKERMNIIQENGYATFEVEHFKKNGSRFPLEVYVKLVDWKGSKVMLSIATDISKRRKMLHDIITTKAIAEESEEKYRTIFNKSMVSILVTDDNGNYLSANNAACNLLGYSMEEIMKMNVGDLKSSNNQDTAEKFQAYISKGEENGEFDFITKAGEYKTTIYHAVRIRENFNLSMLIDVTKQKKAEEEILLNNERLESLLKISQLKTTSLQELIDYALNEAINLTKSKIGYIYFYDEQKRQFTLNSWSKEVMKECTVRNPQTVYDLDKTGCWGEAVRQRKPIVMNDFQADNDIKKGTPEGHVVMKKFLTIPVIFDNKIVAVSGVANKQEDYNNSDIRQLTLLMDSVWKISERILLIKDLTIAKEKAEKANQLKTEFLNNMSHEIRTPMNGIIGFSEMINDPHRSDEEKKYFTQLVQNSSHQLLRIIDAILEISILETKQEIVNEEQFSLNDLIMELFTLFDLQSKGRNFPLYVKKAFNDSESLIISDKAKLHRIMSNLLENALKYTNQGFVEMGYFVKAKNLVLYVKDTGIGISPQNHEVIFERFSQEDKDLSRKYGGLGLGLSISKENAMLLGGDITLESEKGKGSTFFVTIPHKPAQKTNTSDLESSLIDTDKKHYTVLVAEDEVVNYLFIEALFKNEKAIDYHLIHAKNGKEAVDICMENNNIDIVLMDIKMPVMNGLEATQKIKFNNPRLPIIAQTAYSSEADKILILKSGCDEFISKPINKEQLFKLINKYLT